MGHYLLQNIQHIRENEEVLLYGKTLRISEKDQEETTAYLLAEYLKESFDYPYQAPAFDAPAAFWGAKTVYYAMQLMLHRELHTEEAATLFTHYEGLISPSAILSADLTLRFLPSIINQLKLIDPEDGLIMILEELLQVWHYSGISYSLETSRLGFDIIVSDKCLFQSYTDRVIEYKKVLLANHDALASAIRGSLGIFGQEFWKDLEV
jgi:MoxR-vWA-beta-propeller ternary system domain bpX4